MDALLRELKRAVGLGGRDRPTGSDAERARINVVRSLRRAIAAIAVQAPLLGAHLDESVRTGGHCIYLPDPPPRLSWRVATTEGPPRLSAPFGPQRNDSFHPGERLRGVGTAHGSQLGERAVRVSHVAVVTGDLDGFRAFYEDVIGLETTLVFGAGPGHGRQAVLAAGEVMLHVFEVPGYDPTTNGFSPAMFERGRLDHLGFTVADVAALGTLRDRLVAVDASSGVIRRVGPMLSLRFHDPDESEGEINCLDPGYDPSTLRDEDEMINPLWFARMASALHADPTPPDPGGPMMRPAIEQSSTAAPRRPDLA